MIRQNYKDWFLRRITGIDSTSMAGAYYIALAYFVSETQFTEIPNLGKHNIPCGYKRYPLSGNISLSDGIVTNTNTLYFDEATDDWMYDANYFALLTSGGSVVAWGEIVDQYGNPKAITVKKEQLPIIRAHQLKISLSEVERNKYSVNFEQNGGTGATNLQNLYCIPGDVVSVKPGFVFDTWYLDQELTNVAVPGTPLVANTTLFAKWLEARLVSFSVDGEVINTQTVGDSRTAYYFEPTKEGHEFKGWFKEDTFENQFNFETPITADITLYAKFVKITE